MADTSKDELLLGGEICHVTTGSKYHARSKQVFACVRNIVYTRKFLAIFHLLARKNI